jgi:hypothetical protein
MSHYAEINNDGIVQRVIVAEQDFIDSGAVGDANNWVQTSYNTRGGVHYAPNSNEPDGGIALRKNYAGIGYTYDLDKDAFIAPQPYPSWILGSDTCQWNAPVAHPMDGKGPYDWDEDTISWVSVD